MKPTTKRDLRDGAAMVGIGCLSALVFVAFLGLAIGLFIRAIYWGMGS